MYFFASSAVLVVVAAFICLVTAPFDPNRRLLHYFACWWGHHYIQIVPKWTCHFEGKEHIDPAKTYVLVANHQSFVDIIVLYGLMRPFKWVSKESIFKIPFVGWNMLLNQYVQIKRGNMSSIKDMLQTCRQWLMRGASVLIFPEGTRSEHGELQAFRDGAFRLSSELGLPVVPIVVDGTHKIMPKHSNTLCFVAPITVKILPPVSPKDVAGGSAQLRNHVHKLMQETLSEMRREKAPELVLSQ
ncbi:MAG: 1-acyl-sn-glycerol-3-phosphate acyltransferase [Candidatus Melainabacteria bacterium]|nr:1-acyl-sn-glycerol-3-phosphate acyltransferase [Candidatus Melainabacteria bacterium]